MAGMTNKGRDKSAVDIYGKFVLTDKTSFHWKLQ
jgi:hypothetical protein